MRAGLPGWLVSWLIGWLVPLGRGGEAFAEGGDHDALAVAAGPLSEERGVLALLPPTGEDYLLSGLVVEGSADVLVADFVALADGDDLSGLDRGDDTIGGFPCRDDGPDPRMLVVGEVNRCGAFPKRHRANAYHGDKLPTVLFGVLHLFHNVVIVC